MKKLFAVLFASALLFGAGASAALAAPGDHGAACPPSSHNPGGNPNCGHAPPVQPPAGNCQSANIVLLNAQNKIVCVYLGPTSPLASTDAECPDALIAVPVDNVVGVCVFLPPAQ